MDLGVVVINVIENIADKSAAFDAVGHFGQEVRKIEVRPEMAYERFAHSDRFSDSMVAN